MGLWSWLSERGLLPEQQGRRYVAFDIETAKILPDGVTDLLVHRPLGISCAAALAADRDEATTWCGSSESHQPAQQMSQPEVQVLVRDLSSLVSDGYTLLTWNGLGFDFNVLAEESGMQDECERLALGHVDMMFHAVCVLGHFVSLQKAADGMGVKGKPEGMSGAEAPAAWAAGRHQDVLDYAVHDVRATLGLARASERRREMVWITRHGAASCMPLPNGWLDVRQANALPEPDTSWMTDPPRRQQFTEWIRGSVSNRVRPLRLAENASIDPTMGGPGVASQLDPHGQPLNLRFNRARRAERDVSEMLGLVKGVLADGVVTEPEAVLFGDWLAQHPDAVEQWPVNVLKARLDRIFADGKVDERERRDLAQLLESIVGGEAGIVAGEDAATELPLDHPPPEITWPDSVFVFTGKFAFGPRAKCERHVVELGGLCERGVTRRTDYLVIGTFASRDWVQTSFGRKIEKAVRYRDKGVPVAIVAEDRWADALP